MKIYLMIKASMRTWNRWPRFSHKYFSTMGSKVLGFSNYGVV
jgi:hypothetical protein